MGWGIVGEAYNRRLSAAILKKVTAVHICGVVEQIIAGEISQLYKESTDYDVITEDGMRLPPKAVFGMAASEALGFEVHPRNIRGARNTSCFKEIENAGYRIVPKGQEVPRVEFPPDPEEVRWSEGSKYLKMHFRRERKSGLSRAKRQAFKEEHGRLFCEECGLDPVKAYGSDIGEACIEVHHIFPLGKSGGARVTRLEDLKCLCANCHRVTHRKEYYAA